MSGAMHNLPKQTDAVSGGQRIVLIFDTQLIREAECSAISKRPKNIHDNYYNIVN